MSASLAAVGDLFTPRERGRWQGLLRGFRAGQPEKRREV